MSRLGPALLLLVVSVCGCTHPAPAVARPRAPRVVLHPDGQPAVTVDVEVARTDAETQRGLMYRDHLDDGRGMLFLFREPRHLVFWMRNTYIPLDMVFITAGHRVLGVVERATPLTDDPRGVDGDSQYVLEVPGGWTQKARLAPGTPTDFVDVD